MYLLLKAAYHVGKVVCGLRVFGEAGFLRLLLILRQLFIAELLYLQLARNDIHGQFLHVFEIPLIHLVHHADVLHQDDLMLFKGLDYLVDVDLGLVILRLERRDVLGGLLEQAKEALLFFGVEVQPLKLDDQIAQHTADLAQILRADAAQRGLGEFGNVLLRVGAVIHDLLGVQNVDLFRKGLDRGLLGGGELLQLRTFYWDILLHFLFGRCGGLRHGFRGRLKGKSGNIAFLFVHVILSFPDVYQISKSLPPARPSLASILFITSISVSMSSA